MWRVARFNLTVCSQVYCGINQLVKMLITLATFVWFSAVWLVSDVSNCRTSKRPFLSSVCRPNCGCHVFLTSEGSLSTDLTCAHFNCGSSKSPALSFLLIITTMNSAWCTVVEIFQSTALDLQLVPPSSADFLYNGSSLKDLTCTHSNCATSKSCVLLPFLWCWRLPSAMNCAWDTHLNIPLFLHADGLMLLLQYIFVHGRLWYIHSTQLIFSLQMSQSSSFSSTTSTGKKLNYNKHLPRSFLLNYGEVMQDPSDEVIWNNYMTWTASGCQGLK